MQINFAWLNLVLASLVALGFLAAPAWSTEPLLPNSPTLRAWSLYRDRFVQADGRVTDTRNGAISHSESQGYGLLIAVHVGDASSFARIWSWTERNLYIRGDHLAAWKWDPATDPHVVDRNNATDGDLLIAWALAQAAEKWGNTDYRAQASAIATAIADKAIVKTTTGTYLLPGVQGFSDRQQPDGPVVNLSYWVFPAIRDLGALVPSFPAKAMLNTGLSLISRAKFGKAELPAEWTSVKDAEYRPAASYPAQFSYNAIRVPLYLAWFSRDYPQLLGRFQRQWSDSRGLGVIDLHSGRMVERMSDPGYAAIRNLVDCSLGNQAAALRAGSFTATDYYPSTLFLLSLMAASDMYPECNPGGH
jgi:endoglucanase